MTTGSYHHALVATVAEHINRTAYYSMNHTDAIEKSYRNGLSYLASAARNRVAKFAGSGTSSAGRAVVEFQHSYQFLYEKLERPEDRELLLRIAARRCLDAERVPLVDLRQERTLLRRLAVDVQRKAAKDDFVDHHGWRMWRANLEPYGHEFDFYVNAIVLLYSFVRQQYEYPEVGFAAKPGDVVLDAGACYGDNALTFASKVGDAGRVFAFEMVPDNIDVMRKNLQINEHLAQRIEVVDRPLHNRPDERLYIHKRRAGAHVAEKPDPTGVARVVETTTVDDFVRRRNLRRLDFVKMDIEGAEMNALAGARRTIETFRPKLAICVYHKPEDLDVIPRYIASLDASYRFYLRHYSGSLLESVLYCL